MNEATELVCECGEPKGAKSAHCKKCSNRIQSEKIKAALDAGKKADSEAIAPAAPVQPPPPAKFKKVPPKMAADIERAKQARADRRAAPMTSVGHHGEILQKKLIRQYAPECVTRREIRNGKSVRIDPEYHSTFVPKEQYEDHNVKGYEPILKDSGALVTSEHGDIAMKIPFDMYLDGLEGPKAEAQWRLREPAKNADKENPDVVSETLTKG